MTGARVFISHARQFGFGIADGFVSTNNRIDSGFAFGLQF